MTNGWIKLHRSLMANPVVMKDAEHLAVWTYLLLNVAHEPHSVYFNKRRFTLNAGELITSRAKIADALSMDSNKVGRILQLFESEQQIEQRGTNAGRLISLLNWVSYQKSEQQSEQPVNSETNSRANSRMNSKVNSRENAQTQTESGFADDDSEELNSGVNSETNSKVNSKVNTTEEVLRNKRSIKSVRPTVEEVRAYCEERCNGIDAQHFIDYYESNGWKVGRSTMKDWKAAVRNWERREKPKSVPFQNQHAYDFAALERELVGRSRG